VLWPAEKKTPEQPTSETLDAEILVERYEHLRQEVLSNGMGSRLGISVLLRQGLVGWIRVQAVLTATDPPAPAHHLEPPPLSEGLAGELTRILTQLIVTRKELHSCPISTTR
jgi:hypothetical protein